MNTKTSSEPVGLPPFIEARRQALPMDLSFRRWSGPVSQWRETVSKIWHDLLPSFDSIPEGHLNDERVSLRFSTGAVTEGRLRFPAGKRPHPAILLLHDHGGLFDQGHAKMFAGSRGAEARDRFYGGIAPAERFLEAGMAVLCLDAIGFGRRWNGGYEGQQKLSAALMGLGWSLAGVTAAEDAQAARWLAARPDVTQIGAFGFSFGGFRAWQVAALCPEIRAAASVGWMARRCDLMRPGAPLLAGQSAFHFLHPGLAHRADFSDLAGLAKGTPYFFRSGRDDQHMPEESVAAAWQQISAIREADGNPQLDTALHDYGHTCPPPILSEAAAFLKSTLS